jgi:hypothetical protein
MGCRSQRSAGDDSNHIIAERTLRTFTKGGGFTEVGLHRVSQMGGVPAVVEIARFFPTIITYLVDLRIDEAAPTCR